jgi:maltose phosphorylase
MGGTWMAFVQAFGGMRVRNGQLHFSPIIPDGWNSYSFRINFRGAHLEFKINKSSFRIINHSKVQVDVLVHGKLYAISAKLNLVLEN